MPTTSASTTYLIRHAQNMPDYAAALYLIGDALLAAQAIGAPAPGSGLPDEGTQWQCAEIWVHAITELWLIAQRVLPAEIYDAL